MTAARSKYRDSDKKVQGFNLTRGQVMEIHCGECGLNRRSRASIVRSQDRVTPIVMQHGRPRAASVVTMIQAAMWPPSD